MSLLENNSVPKAQVLNQFDSIVRRNSYFNQMIPSQLCGFILPAAQVSKKYYNLKIPNLKHLAPRLSVSAIQISPSQFEETYDIEAELQNVDDSLVATEITVFLNLLHDIQFTSDDQNAAPVNSYQFSATYYEQALK